jgi:hypothetical protein
MRSPGTTEPIPARVATGIEPDQEIRRREQLEALEQAAGTWADANHPELANGAEAWVREMRDASVKRLQDSEDPR